MGEVQGLPQLQARIKAISTPHPSNMKLAGNLVVGRLKRNIPGRKTGSTGRSIVLASYTETTAHITGNAVTVWLDEGTGLYGPHHERITPQTAQALRWAAGPAGSLRLSGRIRKGKAGAGAGFVFAKSTKGMEARPYIARSLKQGSSDVARELKVQIIAEWNSAA